MVDSSAAEKSHTAAQDKGCRWQWWYCFWVKRQRKGCFIELSHSTAQTLSGSRVGRVRAGGRMTGDKCLWPAEQQVVACGLRELIWQNFSRESREHSGKAWCWLSREAIKSSCENREVWQRATELWQFSATGIWIVSKMCWECLIWFVKSVCIHESGMQDKGMTGKQIISLKPL